MSKDKKKNKARKAFKEAVEGKLLNCQFKLVAGDKSEKLAAFHELSTFLLVEFAKVSSKERSKYIKHVRGRITEMGRNSSKLKKLLTGVVDECEEKAQSMPEPTSE